jgi:hypothetical protein
MTTMSPSAALVPVRPVFTDAERLALAGFPAGYRGLTREACTLDLRQFTAWRQARSLPLFSVRRAGIEAFARELEERGRARATVTRRLRTIAGLCKSAAEEELPGHSPAAHARLVSCSSSAKTPAYPEPAGKVTSGSPPPAGPWRPLRLPAIRPRTPQHIGSQRRKATPRDTEETALERRSALFEKLLGV